MLFHPPLLSPLDEGAVSTDSPSSPDSVTGFKIGPPDIKADAKRVFKILRKGGIAICPATVGYMLMTTNTKSLAKIFTAKRSGAHERYVLGGTFEICRAVHDLSPLNAKIIDTLTQDFDLPLVVIAKYRPEHLICKNIDDIAIEACTADGTLAMLINAGKILDEISKLAHAEDLPLFLRSANLSRTGMSLESTGLPLKRR
jgi:tRNA A37 threonylcarbamoyladenosine synthetase subunit TsaC/SUA5/YrdC